MSVRRLGQVITMPAVPEPAKGSTCCHNEELEAVDAERLVIAERDLETCRAVLEDVGELLHDIIFELEHRDDRNETENKLVVNELTGLKERVKHAVEGETE